MKIKDSVPYYEKGNYSVHHANGEGLVNYCDAEDYCKNLPNIEVFYHDSLMVCTHNMPCNVCKVNHAVFISSAGLFEPCWSCQKQGYKLIKEERDSLMYKIKRFFGYE